MSYPCNRALLIFLLASSWLVCTAVSASDAAVGKALYEKNCAICHGVSGDGKGPATKDMDRNPRSFVTADFKFDTDADWQRGTDADITNAISQSAEAFGGSPLMPAWGQQLSQEDMDNLVAYIRTLENSDHRFDVKALSAYASSGRRGGVGCGSLYQYLFIL